MQTGVTTAVTTSAAWSRSRDPVANVVRKQWKCAHVECSARFNWRVVALFRELMKSVDHSVRQRAHRGGAPLGAGVAVEPPAANLATYRGGGAGPNAARPSAGRLHEAVHRNNCVIL